MDILEPTEVDQAVEGVMSRDEMGAKQFRYTGFKTEASGRNKEES